MKLGVALRTVGAFATGAFATGAFATGAFAASAFATSAAIARRCVCLLVACPLAFVSGEAESASPDALAAPREPVVAEWLAFASKVDEVFVRATIEGRSVSSYRFDAEGSPAQVLRAARDAWAARGSLETVTARSGPWQVLSARDQDEYRTLQVRARPGGGVSGILSVWHAMTAAPRTASLSSALLPAGAIVLRSIGAVDGGQAGETIVAVSANGLDWVAGAVDSLARGAGFRRDRIGTRAALHGEEAMFFKRGSAELAITLVEGEGGTAIVIHQHRSGR